MNLKDRMKPFSFGIYPGGQLGTTTGMTSGLPDLPVRIQSALDELQGEQASLMVRCYIIFKGGGLEPLYSTESPEQYAVHGRLLDLVLCFQSFDEDLQGWLDLIHRSIELYHPYLGKLQITEEANVNLPVLDGHYPKSRMALVRGIIEADRVAKKMGLEIPIGFNATPDFSPNKEFWKEISALANEHFYKALAFVGLDFFPDTFRPVPGADDEAVLEAAIVYIINHYRRVDLSAAGIHQHIPIHITENGWPTGEGRTEEKQAERIEKIIRIIFKLKDQFNITHYELFSLRDADSKNPDIFYGFGIMKDDYTTKKAFFTFQRLIQELGENAAGRDG